MSLNHIIITLNPIHSHIVDSLRPTNALLYTIHTHIVDSLRPTNALLYTIILVSNVNIKTLKSTPTCFDHYSDHLQGVRKFLVKVPEFKI